MLQRPVDERNDPSLKSVPLSPKDFDLESLKILVIAIPERKGYRTLEESLRLMIDWEKEKTALGTEYF